MSHASQSHLDRSIAIIGMAGTFPGARNIDQFWQNLHAGTESIQALSDEALTAAGVERSLLADPSYIKMGALLEEIDHFDASFFGFSPSEAAIMDPQHRLVLECAWEALENAGYVPNDGNGWTGVYVGGSLSTYLLYNLARNRDLVKAVGLPILLGNDKDYIPTRISYKLNLKGPSFSVSTACSTSLVAVHLACQDLLSQQCDMALAGGVEVKVPHAGYVYREGDIFAPDGHCRSFDARAQGTIFGSGLGLVVLKRYQDAIADGDHIHAVIRGTALNNDGSEKVGYTAPSINGQAEVIALAQAIAGVEPESITYVETHGTGTLVGDPIEFKALETAFRAGTDRNQFCAIGSVKTNIGHLNSASGIAGLIKTVLALKHHQLPASLHFETPNPAIDFEHSPFYVNTQLREWTSQDQPLRAGINSFGIGGTNSHIVLEEAPPCPASTPSRPWQLLLLSAKTPTALDQSTERMVSHLQQPESELADVAYTLQVGRQAFEHRRMLVCQTSEEAAQHLGNLASDRVLTRSRVSAPHSVVFLFPGQGAQYVNMGRDLYDSEPLFRACVDDCAEQLQPHLGLDLRPILYSDNEAAIATATHQLQQTAIAQPALFVIEYALAQLWITWGVQPEAMLGHSVGEYVAACLAGVFSLETALALIAIRGRLMQQMPSGAMLAISLAADALAPWLGPELELAVLNGPNSSVVSGPEAAIADLQQRLQAQSINCRRLQTSHAFHSQMMAPIVETFVADVATNSLQAPQIPYLSNVTGTWITATEATQPEYWGQHLRQTVQFSSGVEQLLLDPHAIVLEVGPGRTLTSLIRRQFTVECDRLLLTSLRHPKEQKSDAAGLMTTLGQLWLAGCDLNWRAFYQHEQRYRVPLPTYPFQRKRYWVDPVDSLDSTDATVKQTDLADWFYIPTWKRAIPLFQPQPQHDVASPVLIFLDEQGWGQQLASRLSQAQKKVITVQVGETFAQVAEDAYCLNPGELHDYKQFCKVLSEKNCLPQTVLHLWNLTSETASKTPECVHCGSAQTKKNGFYKGQQAYRCKHCKRQFLASAVVQVEIQQRLARLTAQQQQSFYSLIYWAQAISKYLMTDRCQIAVVSNQLQSVLGTETLCPEKGTLLGPVTVIPQEYPNLSCCSIDLALSKRGKMTHPDWVDVVLAEVIQAEPARMVAYRTGQRWLPLYESQRLEVDTASSIALKPKGLYMITGGLGGLGLAIAHDLAQRVQAKLVLIGRSPFPPASEWDYWLQEQGEDNRTSQKIRQLQALEDLGAEVLILQADVTNLDSLLAAMEQIDQRWGTLNGVIHAAGIAGGCIVQRQKPAIADNVLQPKLQGTLHLLAALQEQPLDFLVLFSSLASKLGGLGQVAYCAANAFLDAFAIAESARPDRRTVAINWDFWQDIGMGVTTEIPEDIKAFRVAELQQGMTPQEGLEAFHRILSGCVVPQVLVSTTSFTHRIDQWIQLKALSEATSFESVGVTERYSRPELANLYVPPRDELEEQLAEIFQSVIGIDQVGIHDNFFELGGHSLMATQVLSRLREVLKTEVQLHSLFETPTVAGIASTSRPADNSAPTVDDRTAVTREEVVL
ncbi:SDR family NAD(P)-dependent oxidoreductase [Oscillatoria sp. CS-180]|uniref:type I polyketide synthase n=1 Tax=Oscillatoria sp. CS-180 TaxID=3021720 RepID=UPI00232DC212|nr:type I polyketide synthase [Oscillatoria sp. CS-180]MDB9527410.1 SDR family NAD(P)-dependent oxidoreductase [Oscillatoria sp. CS-180]